MTKTSRRNFLKVSTLATGGFMMAINMPGNAAFFKDADANSSFGMNAYLKIDLKGNIEFLLTKHEMGQGSGTGLPMILADELGADWSKLSIKRSDYDKKFSRNEMGTTGGSSTIYKMWEILRNAGAAAREMLKQAAAEEWNVNKDNLKAENNYIVNLSNNKKIEFGKLVNKASKLPVPENPRLKETSEFVYIGKPVKNLITKDVVLGKGNYGINTDVPNMVYAAIEKCPVFKGKLKSFDDTEAKKVTGVIDVFAMSSVKMIDETTHIQEGVVVVAKSTWSAFKAKKLLEIEWDKGEFANANMDTLKNSFSNALKEKSDPVYEKGNIDELINKNGYEVFEAEYDNPYQAHALMEPINSTVHFKGDTCEVWVGTQNGGEVAKEVAHVTGLTEDKVTVHVLNSGGSFGRRGADSSVEAAFISKKIKLPVKLTWDREAEIAHDHFHPYQRSIHKAIISDNKKVLGWETKILRTDRRMTGDNIWEIPYDFPNIRTFGYPIKSIVHTGAWRSVAVHSSSLGRESFMDELALRLGKDPIQFRLDLLQEEIVYENVNDDENFSKIIFDYRKTRRNRYLSVLNEIKEKGLWDNQPMPKGKGRGIAIDSFSRTICAHIVDVTLDDSNYNGFKVDKVTSVLHCGTLVNPHFGKGQVEGSIIWALSALKYGGIEVKDGVVQRDNFHDNLLLRIDESPEIEVHFVKSTEKPTMLGEPATPPLAPAVLNALYAASGKRIRKIPVLKEDLKETITAS